MSRCQGAISRLNDSLKCLALGVFLLAAIAVSAHAQTSQASIRGTVHDTSNAVIVGANISLFNVATHVTTATTTNSAGDYIILDINPGTYTLEVSNKGFTSQKLKPFVLQVNQTSTLDFFLAVGGMETVIQVEAVGNQIEASTTELAMTLEAKQISDLPLDSRNFTELFVAAPGVSPIVVSGSQTMSYTTGIGPSMIPSFNGQTNRSDLFLVDGILDVETFGNAYAVQPGIDYIENMKLESHNDSAEFGGSTGGTINVSTKSGTNTLHGSAWEFNKTNTMQALAYFTPHGTPQTPFTQNQWGGTLGGPVVIPKLYHGKNKTFFFAGYEDLRYSGPGTWSALVPTAQELSGDFTADAPIYDPATTTCDANLNCTREQFSYNGRLNVIDPKRIAAGNVYYAQHIWPAAGMAGAPAGSNTFQNAPNNQDLYTFDARVDENLGANNSVFFRYMTLKGNQTSGRTQLPAVQSTNAYSYVGSYTHTFSAVSVLHVQGGRTYESRPQTWRYKNVPADIDSQVGFPTQLDTGFTSLGNIIPGIEIQNGVSEVGEDNNSEVTANSWSVKSDYTHLLGKHTFKLGGEYNGIGESQTIEYAELNFSNQETASNQNDSKTGNGVASFVLGVPNAFTKRNLAESITPGGIMGYYLQDQWQVSPKLTINLGARYDLALIPKYGTPALKNQDVGNFDFNNGTYVVYKVPGSCASLGNAPCIPTADGSLPAHVVASPDGKVFQNQYNNFQPRIGAAYRMTPTMVIHGGFGIAFDNYAALVQNLRGVSGNWPSVGQVAKSSINVPTSTSAFPGYTTQNLPAMTALPDPTPFNQFNWFVDPKMKDAYSLQWNFGVQRQLDSVTVVSATYVGSANRRLSYGDFYNTATTPGPGNPSLRSPYPYIAPTFYSMSKGEGNYNALQVQLTRSFHNGLAATVAYTWSKSIDEGCSGFFGSEGCSIQQVYNIKAERSVSAFDVPQNLVATWNYALPVGRGKALNVDNRILDLLVGGWQYSGFAKFHSGNPYEVTDAADIANIGSVNWWPYIRPNITGSVKPANQSAQSWLNYNSFSDPAPYTYGATGRNNLRTQFFKGTDMSVFKEVKFKDRYAAKFTFDAFNVLNLAIWGQPNSAYSAPNNGQSTAPNFGVISSTASGARTIQMSGKFSF
ncbi:MAG: TonB-dependent receptor [Terracidiphilus sp.]